MQEISESDDEIRAAERAVDDARSKLVAELEAASESGRVAIARVVHQARPLVLVAAALAGAAVLVGTVALVRNGLSRARTRANHPRYSLAPRQHSLFGQLARQALTSAASTLAASLARRVLLSLEVPTQHKAQLRTNGAAR